MPFTGSNTILQPLILANMGKLTASDPAATPNLAPMATALSTAFATWIVNPSVAKLVATNPKPLDGLPIPPGGGPIQIPKVELDIKPLPSSEKILATQILLQSSGLSSADPAAAKPTVDYSNALAKAVHNWLEEDGVGAVTNSSPILGAPSTAVSAGGEPIIVPPNLAILNVTGLDDTELLKDKIIEEVSKLTGSDPAANKPLEDSALALADALTQWFKIAGVGGVVNSIPWTGAPPIVPPAAPPAVPVTPGVPKWAVAPQAAKADFI